MAFPNDHRTVVASRHLWRSGIAVGYGRRCVQAHQYRLRREQNGKHHRIRKDVLALASGRIHRLQVRSVTRIMAVNSDVSSKLMAWLMAGAGTLLAYSAVRNRKPWDVLRDVTGTPISDGAKVGTDLSGGSTGPMGFTGTYGGSVPRLRQIANREIQPTLVDIQPCGKLDVDAAASKARIDQKLGYVVPASSCGDAYRSYADQAAAHASGELMPDGKPRFADPNKGLHVVGLAFDINSAYLKPEVFAAFKAEGWHQTRPVVEPWHFSYGVRG